MQINQPDQNITLLILNTSINKGTIKQKGGVEITSRYLKEFEKLNTTTESIYDLGDFKVLIILKDGTNLTDWKDVENIKDIIFVSENLSDYISLGRYEGFKSLKAIVTPEISDELTRIGGMFTGCSSLVDLSPLSGWDTSKVTDMSWMFGGCSALVDLSPLSGWDISKVNSMYKMFEGCSALVDLSPLSNWDTSQVTDMSGMFEDCSGLVDLSDLSGWNVSNVKYMDDMFKGCKSLKEYPEWY